MQAGISEKRAKELRNAADRVGEEDGEYENAAEAQIAAIEQSFAAAQLPITHKTKPHLTAVEVLKKTSRHRTVRSLTYLRYLVY